MGSLGVIPRGEARSLREGVERMLDLDRAGAGEAEEERSGRRRRRRRRALARESHVRSGSLLLISIRLLIIDYTT